MLAEPPKQPASVKANSRNPVSLWCGMCQTLCGSSAPGGIVPTPPGRRGQVDPPPPVEEADHAPVSGPWHAGLQVVHDAQILGHDLEAVLAGVLEPERSGAAQPALLHVFIRYHGGTVHLLGEAGLVRVLLQVGQVQLGERHKLRVQFDELQVFVVELAQADALPAEGQRAGDLGPDAGAALPLLRLPHPVVPEGGGPLGLQLLPGLPEQHPAQTREEVGAVEERRLAGVHHPVPAVVVPGRSAPQGGVQPQHWVQGPEILKEVWRHLQERTDG